LFEAVFCDVALHCIPAHTIVCIRDFVMMDCFAELFLLPFVAGVITVMTPGFLD